MDTYNGRLISELGVEKYLKANSDLAFSNISFFDDTATQERKWKDCNFGCHTPGYRSLKRSATWIDTLTLLDKIDPLAAGIADGIRHQAVVQPAMLGAGIERTAEGLHLAGAEKFSQVGGENWAAIDLLTATYEALFEYELNLLENPVMQCVVTVVNDYISVLPEWVMDELQNSGILNTVGQVDTAILLKAAKYGAVQAISSDEAQAAGDFLKGKTKRVIGKQIGKKVANAIAAAISVQIAKKIMAHESMTYHLKRRLAGIRKQIKPAKGGLGGALVTLLKAQGLLGLAAKSSRNLKDKCPTTWHTLRYKLRGCDMVYFLIEPLISEYVDRLSLLEKRPVEFLKVMQALIKEKQTVQIFFPGAA
ncbi:hypothetical protein R50072_08030 [Simiduia litorea]|uniref:cellulose-binding protein n=1 Tax=Simiduia litorea TaxID=1435348 RepID=UPI0036F25298